MLRLSSEKVVLHAYFVCSLPRSYIVPGVKVRDVEESKRVNANVQERMAQRRAGEADKEDAR